MFYPKAVIGLSSARNQQDYAFMTAWLLAATSTHEALAQGFCFLQYKYSHGALGVY